MAGTGLKAIGLEKLIKVVGSLPKQIRFATAVTITQTLKRVQIAEIQESDRAFIIRKPWNSKGPFAFKITQFPNKNSLVGILGSKSPWLKGQTDKKITIRTKDKGKFTPMFITPKRLAKEKNRKTPKRLTINALRQDPKAFQNKETGDWFRAKGKKLEVVLFKTDTAKLTGPMEFTKTADKVIAKFYDKIFNKNFLNALRSAR